MKILKKRSKNIKTPTREMVVVDEPMELNHIYNEDCLETMSRMDRKMCSGIITSPPYNIGENNYDGSQKYKNSADNKEDYFEWSKTVINECIRVSDLTFYNIQLCSYIQKDVFNLIGQFSDRIKDVFVWGKTNPQPTINDGVFALGHELIICFSSFEKAKKRTFDRLEGHASNLLMGQVNSGNEYSEEHNATFPKKVPSFFISNLFNEGDIIYDPFMGTGTTAVSCIDHNVDFIGSEVDEDYCEISRARVKKERDQLKML